MLHGSECSADNRIQVVDVPFLFERSPLSSRNQSLVAKTPVTFCWRTYYLWFESCTSATVTYDLPLEDL